MTADPHPAPVGEPPYGVLPGMLAWPVLACSGDEVMVQLLGTWIYPQGLLFLVDVQYTGRLPPPDGGDLAAEVMPGGGLRAGLTDPDTRQLDAGGFGVTLRYDDGRVAAITPGTEETADPSGDLVLTARGGGRRSRWSLTYWASPLPSCRDSAHIGVRWTSRGIQPTEFDVDSAAMAEALADVRLGPSDWPPEQMWT